jgi:hypothetical protein
MYPYEDTLNSEFCSFHCLSYTLVIATVVIMSLITKIRMLNTFMSRVTNLCTFTSSAPDSTTTCVRVCRKIRRQTLVRPPTDDMPFLSDFIKIRPLALKLEYMDRRTDKCKDDRRD